MTVEGDLGTEILDLWKRNILDVIRQLISDPRFRDHIRYGPERLWTPWLPKRRVYSEMWTDNWWWQMQVRICILGWDTTIVPLIFASDATQLSVLSGGKKAWPVYLTIGNISKLIRRQPSQRATLLVGYIPVTDLSCISDPDARREKSWELFHACMAEITVPLRRASIEGVEMKCADGGVRRIHPIPAAHVADFPEQCTGACTMTSRCPICTVKYHARGGPEPAPLRTKHETIHVLEQGIRGYLPRRKSAGVCPTWPFWADLPFVNGAQCVTPDLLHQLNKGVFKYHLVKWYNRLLGATEIDRRYMGMPGHHGIRHFKWGLSKITQWTRNEAKAIAKVFLPAVAGSQPAEAVGAARCVLDFMYHSHLPQIDEVDLDEMESDLAGFHDYKDIFRLTGALTGKKLWNGIPKIHMLSHYTSSIRELGSMDRYNTEAPERLHIDCVKEGYRVSNRVNPTKQMAMFLQRREVWAMLYSQLEERGIVPRRKIHRRGIPEGDFGEEDGDEPEDEFEDQGPEADEEDGDGGDDDDERMLLRARQRRRRVSAGRRIYQPNPIIRIAKRTPHRVLGSYLINRHEATDLIPATLTFLRQKFPQHQPFYLNEESSFCIWTRCNLQHRPLPFAPLVGAKTDTVRTFPATYDGDGRLTRVASFDTVLLDEFPDKEGLHRYIVVCIRAIFTLSRHYRHLYSGHLAYVELFNPFSVGCPDPHHLHTCSHVICNNSLVAHVVPLSRLHMTCHLAPLYSTINPNTVITSNNDLLSDCNWFYFNPYSSYYMYSLATHWRRQR
ncbi:hypothetical protein BDV93DRAFT_460613 [Ceratobasidium sp. AG-I]|nr:hypothetical protein BDV93DRAFT_460613 [Ceratobasidium sp. AG-I]